MARSIFNKEILRSITGSPGRFVAIFAIVALGVGFYAGLRMTAPDMRLAADAFYDETALMDVRVVSTMGLADGDVEALSQVEGVSQVMEAYETDVVADIADEPYVIRVHSLPYSAEDSPSESDIDQALESSLNQPILEEGAWPTTNSECVMSADRIMNTPLQIGDKVRVTECSTGIEDMLRETEYTVVGLAHSSYYASSTSMGSTTLGTGLIQQFMYVPESDFQEDFPPTEAYLSVTDAIPLVSGSDEYQSVVDAVVSRIEGIAAEREQARLAEVRADAQAELDEKRAEFEQQKAEAAAQLDDAKDELDYARQQLLDSQSELSQGTSDYNDGITQLESQRAHAESQIAEAQAQIDATEQQLAQAKQQMQQLEGIPGAEAQYEQLRAQVEAGEAQLAAGRQQLAAQKAQAAQQMADAEARLSSARAEIEAGRTQLEEGSAQYDEGLAEYDERKANAETELADAQTAIDDAQRQIDELEAPEWLVMDRTKNYGAESFDSDAGRVNNIAKLFPLVFFLVAALVALTTMTRMVDEERMLIGTYKALGYSRARITSKYLVYAGIASVGGSVAGIALLSFTLPAVIMTAYSIVYIVPIQALAIDWPIAFSAAALGIGITLASTAFASVSTLRESPAALMLPPAPKAGKRILLERIRPVWGHLTFLWKVTCRNIFRYKKRLFMTIVGIAGCTALLLTGFGLQDSINDIIDKHYGELIDYNVIVSFDDDATPDEIAAVDARLEESGDVEKEADAYETPMVVIGDAGDLTAQLIVPENPDAFADVWEFRDRLTHEGVALKDDGAIVTEKIATRFGLDPGDEVVLSEQDEMGNATGEKYSIKVTGIVENYIGHSVFMSPEGYKEAFGEAASPNRTFFRTDAPTEERDSLASEILDMPGVKTVSFNDETIDMYKTALRSVNMVVIVLIVSAALLAFIVLYNLTNINITERAREIATLKVLGFTPREIFTYIFREIAIISVLGALLGLVLGIFLENFVVTTAEVDSVMFGREIHIGSFVVSFLLTMAFTLLVALAMRGKLRRIDMVESLKSNE